MKLHVHLHVSDAHSSVRGEKKKRKKKKAAKHLLRQAFVKRFYALCLQVATTCLPRVVVR